MHPPAGEADALVIGYALLPAVSAPGPSGAILARARWEALRRTQFAIYLARTARRGTGRDRGAPRPAQPSTSGAAALSGTWRLAEVFFDSADDPFAPAWRAALATALVLPVAGILVPDLSHVRPRAPRPGGDPGEARQLSRAVLIPLR